MNEFQNIYNFKGKKVWVTGAGRGIGKEIARQFVALGAEVLGFDKKFLGEKYPFTCVSLDLTDLAAIKHECSHQLIAFGGLDILIHAAGVLKIGEIEKLDIHDWKSCFDVNVTGVFHLLQLVIPHFKKQCRGAIINVSSNAAHVPRLYMSAYCASKAALTALTHCTGLELAKYGVRCNVVSPGSTDTDMLKELLSENESEAKFIEGTPLDYKLGIPLRKIAKPSEIANAVIFLASNMATHITMQDLVIDGGATLSA